MQPSFSDFAVIKLASGLHVEVILLVCCCWCWNPHTDGDKISERQHFLQAVLADMQYIQPC